MWPIDRKRAAKGSVSIEAALCIPLFFAVFLFMYGVLEMFLLYNCVSKAMYRTADTVSSYSIIVNEKGVSRLEKSIQDKLAGYVDLSQLIRYGDDFLYRPAVKAILEHDLDQDAVYQRFFSDRVGIDLSCSQFFNTDNEVLLSCRFSCRYTIPFIDSLLKGFTLKKTLLFRPFGEGVSLSYAQAEGTGDSIWSLSNFERGSRLQEVFGRNLPPYFPTVDFYRSGSVGTIRSLNHTLTTYQDPDRLKKTLERLAEDLLGFSGAVYGDTVIGKADIRQREIILVFPEDDFTKAQETVLEQFIRSCEERGVNVSVKRYQRTEKSEKN